MNFYRVQRAHRNRAIGAIIQSDSPQDSYLSVIGFLKYLGSDVPTARGHSVDRVIIDEIPAPPARRRRNRGVEVGSEPGGPAAVRDEGSDALGSEDGSGG